MELATSRNLLLLLLLLFISMSCCLSFEFYHGQADKQRQSWTAETETETALPAVELSSKKKKGFSGFMKLILMCSLIRISKEITKKLQEIKNCVNYYYRVLLQSCYQ